MPEYKVIPRLNNNMHDLGPHGSVFFFSDVVHLDRSVEMKLRLKLKSGVGGEYGAAVDS
jgi:hypothetical protein